MMDEIVLNENLPAEASEPLPFPFNQRGYCRYEPIEKRVDRARVLIVNNLLRDECDVSEVGVRELGPRLAGQLTRERKISLLAVDNILNNVARLVRNPETCVTHLTEIATAVEEFRPEAIVLSGTLSDFDYYNPEHLEDFRRFINETRTPVLGICGGHQLIGLSFGARVVTLENLEQHEARINRSFEYQYRFIRIVEPSDPIFQGINDSESGMWQDYTREARILRVWQNHGLQLDRVPEGFTLLATAYRCRNQMMVKRSGGQLIYAVQFHLEKSFEDWDRTRATRWEHPNESRDGRIIFENFLLESLKWRDSHPENNPETLHKTPEL
jgi:GMP synthase (glutamine-hydrolysing)